MFFLFQKPNIIYDINGNIKSWNYLKYKMINGVNNYNDLLCLPTIFISFSLISFLITLNIINN